VRRTLIYAHRGASREAAENTRAAFDKALARPIDGIETDVQLSRDGVAVLWHDDDLGKLGLPGKRIDAFDYARLRALNFAAHFPGADREGVAGLKEFVEAYRPRCRLLLEIKRYPGEPAARQRDKVLRTLECAGAEDGRILVSSFDPGSLDEAHRAEPGRALVLNLEPGEGAASARRALRDRPFLTGLCMHISGLNREAAGAAREQDKIVAVYTCNSEKQIGLALKLGVDILITDEPGKALRARDG
jgi:glycerophosphoryl diester phosphodiesterase